MTVWGLLERDAKKMTHCMSKTEQQCVLVCVFATACRHGGQCCSPEGNSLTHRHSDTLPEQACPQGTV